jgi:hypothetical protein
MMARINIFTAIYYNLKFKTAQALRGFFVSVYIEIYFTVMKCHFRADVVLDDLREADKHRNVACILI